MGYKIHTQKSFVLVYVINMQKIKFKTIPFIITPKKSKYLDKNLTKYA